MLLPDYQSELLEAGCDEAGRGCLAGPVFAAAVILPADFDHPLLNDSKKMTEKARAALRPIIESRAIAWQVALVAHDRIDEVNILNASFEAMNAAVSALYPEPGFLLIDGNRFRTARSTPYACIVGGDGLYRSIAAASVLAKTHRDEYMEALDAEYPMYGWRSNKGYPTAMHRRAVAEYGPSPYHRRTFLSDSRRLSLL